MILDNPLNSSLVKVFQATPIAEVPEFKVIHVVLIWSFVFLLILLPKFGEYLDRGKGWAFFGLLFLLIAIIIVMTALSYFMVQLVYHFLAT